MKVRDTDNCAHRFALAGLLALVAMLAVPYSASSDVRIDTALGPPAVRLITREQYIDTLAYVFGEDIKVSGRFPPLARTKGLLALGATTAVLTPGHVDQFLRNAHAVAAQVVDVNHRQQLIPCTPMHASSADARCAQQFFAGVGRLLYRRPLSKEQLEGVVASAGESAARLGDFYQGIAYALAGMLTSPEFLFIAEFAEPDPQHPGQYRLDAYSMAARLSLLLWNSYPDDELLQAAATGALHSPQIRDRQIERLLAAPELERGVRAFFRDMLAFDSFANLAKDPVIYPAFLQQVAADSEEQALRTVTDHLIVQQRDYRELFTTRKTFLTSSLGAIYQVPVAQPMQWVPYEFPADSPRAGLLTEPGFLALYSHAGRSSPTKRGRAVRENLLCQQVPDPPPNVDFSIVEDPHAKFVTARERLTAHNTDRTCSGCHKLTDPIGLAFEKFDGAGQFRATEGGAAIDASGELDGQKYDDAAGLGRALRDNPAIPACLVARLYSYATGHPIAKSERPILKQFEARFAQEGYRLPALLRVLATSPEFSGIASPELVASVPPAANDQSIPAKRLQ